MRCRTAFKYGAKNGSKSAIHKCENCERPLSEKESTILQKTLREVKSQISKNSKCILFYISGVVSRRSCTQPIDSDTFTYNDIYGSFFKYLNRGSLCIPCDSIVDWILFCYFLFQNLDFSIPVCRFSLSQFFLQISSNWFFSRFHKKQAHILSNIFLNNFSISKTPDVSKYSDYKLIKFN